MHSYQLPIPLGYHSKKTTYRSPHIHNLEGDTTIAIDATLLPKHEPNPATQTIDIFLISILGTLHTPGVDDDDVFASRVIEVWWAFLFRHDT